MWWRRLVEWVLTDCVSVFDGGADGVAAAFESAVLDDRGGEGLECQAPEDAVGDVEVVHRGVEAGEEGTEEGGGDAVGGCEEGPVAEWRD